MSLFSLDCNSNAPWKQRWPWEILGKLFSSVNSSKVKTKFAFQQWIDWKPLCKFQLFFIVPLHFYKIPRSYSDVSFASPLKNKIVSVSTLNKREYRRYYVEILSKKILPTMQCIRSFSYIIWKTTLNTDSAGILKPSYSEELLIYSHL